MVSSRLTLIVLRVLPPCPDPAVQNYPGRTLQTPPSHLFVAAGQSQVPSQAAPVAQVGLLLCSCTQARRASGFGGAEATW